VSGAEAPLVVHLTTVPISLEKLLIAELLEVQRLGLRVVGMSAPGPEVAAIEAAGVTHVAVDSLTRSWALRSDLMAFRKLVSELRRIRPDVLHTHTPKAGVMGRVAGRLLGVPVVVNTVHGLWASPDDPARKRLPVLVVEGTAGRCSHAELYQNPEDAALLRRWVGARRQTVVGNGTDLTRFRFDAGERARCRTAWGIADDEVVVLGVGRQVAEKGIVEFCSAVTEVRARGRKVRGIWVGPPDDSRGRWRASPAEEAAVHFAGHVDDMPAVYSAADVFALPSFREGFPRSAMEAAACGRPLVLTDIRGSREIGTDGLDVLVVPPRDAAALAHAIDRLVTTPELRAELAARIQARAAMFDQRRIAHASIVAYRQVASRWSLRSRRRRRWVSQKLPLVTAAPYSSPGA
jgi:glycosyltransferase involved in cell wall biosynthesis